MNNCVILSRLGVIISQQLRFASSISRQSNMLKKLLSGKKKSKWIWDDTSTMNKPKALLETKGTSQKLTSRRVNVLNKLFMRHVTDLIATGPIGMELHGLGLIITNVVVCQNYHGLNVFWTTNSSIDHDLVENKLESINKRLRHELCQMQLMGNIPHITFVRDKKLSYFNEIDHLLANADYGVEHGTIDETKSKLECDFHQNYKSSEINSTLAPMRHDVFGVDHALIMGRIKQNMAKSKQAWKAYEATKSNTESEQTKPFKFATSFETIRNQSVEEKHSKEVLKQFLQKRKLMRKLKAKEDRLIEELLEQDYNNHDEEEELDSNFNDQNWHEQEDQISYENYDDSFK